MRSLFSPTFTDSHPIVNYAHQQTVTSAHHCSPHTPVTETGSLPTTTLRVELMTAEEAQHAQDGRGCCCCHYGLLVLPLHCAPVCRPARPHVWRWCKAIVSTIIAGNQLRSRFALGSTHDTMAMTLGIPMAPEMGILYVRHSVVVVVRGEGRGERRKKSSDYMQT